MKNMRLKAIFAALLIAVALAVLPQSASASSFRPHIKNSTRSLDMALVFGNSTCGVATVHGLYGGDSAKSYGWDSFSATDPFTVQVFSPTTGKRLSGERIYPAGWCVKAYNNDYLIKVFDQG